MFERLSQQQVDEFLNAQQLLQQHRKDVLNPGMHPRLNNRERALEWIAGSESDKFDIKDPNNHKKLAFALLLHDPSITSWKKYDFVNQFDDKQLMTALNLVAEQKLWQHEGQGADAEKTRKIFATTIGIFAKSIPTKAVVEIFKALGSHRGFSRADLESMESLKPGYLSNKDHWQHIVNKFVLADADAVQLMLAKSQGSLSEKQEAATVMNARLEKLIDQKVKEYLKSHQVDDKDIEKLTAEHKQVLYGKLEQLEQEAQKKQFSENLKAAGDVFTVLGKIAGDLGSKEIAGVAAVGSRCIEVGKALQAINHPAITALMDPAGPIGTLVSGLASFHPYLALAQMAFSVGMAIFGKKKQAGPDPTQQALQQLFLAVEHLKKEMHTRFDRVDAKLDNLLQLVDETSYMLKSLMQVNQQITLEQIQRSEKALYDTILYTTKLVEGAVKEGQFNDLNSLLSDINTHVTHQLNTNHHTANSDALTLAQNRLRSAWLLSSLISETYNGANYVGFAQLPLSTSVEVININKEIPPQGILGFLFQYLTQVGSERLGMKETLQLPSHLELPAFDLWMHALRVYLASEMFNVREYNREPNLKDFEKINKILDNTELFVTTIQKNQVEILSQLHVKYLAALEVIKSNLIKEFSAKLKATVDDSANTPYKFDLKKAVQSGWVKITFNNNQVENDLVNQIFSSDFHNENACKLSLGLVLAHLLTGNKINANGSINFRPGDVTPWIIDNTCGGKAHYGIKIKYPSISAAISIGFTIPQYSQNDFLNINYYYGKPDNDGGRACHHLVDGSVANLRSDNENSLKSYKDGTHKPLLKISDHKCQPKQLSTVDQYNSAVIDQTAATYIEAAINNNTQTLLTDSDVIRYTNDLLEQARKTAETNPAYKEAVSNIQAYRKIAHSLVNLLNMPESVVQAVNTTFVTDMDSIYRNLTLFAELKNGFPQLNATLGSIVSKPSILDETAGARKELQDHAAIMETIRLYKLQQTDWEAKLKVYEELQTNYQAMLAFSNTPLKYLNEIETSQLGDRVRQFHDLLLTSYKTLNESYQQLQGLGFNVTKPSSLPVIDLSKIEAHSSDDPSASAKRGKTLPINELRKLSLTEIIRRSVNPLADVQAKLADHEKNKIRSLLDQKDPDGKTALHVAAEINDYEVIQLLVNKGVDISLLDNTQKKAIDYLAKNSVKARVYLCSRENWQKDQENSGFSLLKFSTLLEEGLALLKDTPQYATCQSSGGEKRVGKSTLTSFLKGTNYKRVTLPDGTFILETTNDIAEIAPSGHKAVATTKLPGMYFVNNALRIDNPGYGANRGVEEDIRTAIMTQLTMKYCDKLHTLEFVFAENDFYSAGAESVVKYLNYAGKMLGDNPELTVKNLVIIVTKPTDERWLKVAKGNTTVYEEMLFNRLKKVAKERADDESFSIDHFYTVIDHINVDQILLVDAADVRFRDIYYQRVSKIAPTNTTEFNLVNFDDHTNVIKQLTERNNAYIANLESQIEKQIQALTTHWLQSARKMQQISAVSTQFNMNSQHPMLNQIQSLAALNTVAVAQIKEMGDKFVTTLSTKHLKNEAEAFGDFLSLVNDTLFNIIELEANLPIFLMMMSLSDVAGFTSDSNDCDNNGGCKGLIDKKDNKPYSFLSFFNNFFNLPGAHAEELHTLPDNTENVRLGNDFFTEFFLSNQQRHPYIFNQLPPNANPESVLHVLLQGGNVANNQDSQILLVDYLLRQWNKMELFSRVRKAWSGSLSNDESDRLSNVRAICHDLYRQLPGLALNPGQKQEYRTQLLRLRDQYNEFLADDYVTAAQLEKLEQEVNGLATQLQLEPKEESTHHHAKTSPRPAGFFKTASQANMEPLPGASNFLPLLPHSQLGQAQHGSDSATSYLR